MFFITGIIPVAIIGWFSVNLCVSSLMDKSYDQLESVREIKKNQILELFREKKADMHALVKTAKIPGLNRAIITTETLWGATEIITFGTAVKVRGL